MVCKEAFEVKKNDEVILSLEVGREYLTSHIVGGYVTVYGTDMVVVPAKFFEREVKCAMRHLMLNCDACSAKHGPCPAKDSPVVKAEC